MPLPALRGHARALSRAATSAANRSRSGTPRGTADDGTRRTHQSISPRRVSACWRCGSTSALSARVGEADPAHVRCHVERRGERRALLVGDEHAELARDQLGAEIVRMAAERGPAGAAPLEERPQVGDEAIVPRHQLVQLPAARDVLVLERLRLARLWRPEHRRHHFVVDRGELGATARERSARSSQTRARASSPSTAAASGERCRR